MRIYPFGGVPGSDIIAIMRNIFHMTFDDTEEVVVETTEEVETEEVA